MVLFKHSSKSIDDAFTFTLLSDCKYNIPIFDEKSSIENTKLMKKYFPFENDQSMKWKIWESLHCNGATFEQTEIAGLSLLVDQLGVIGRYVAISSDIALGKGSYGAVFPGYYSKQKQ